MPKKILFFIESLEVGGAEKSLVTLLNSTKFEGYSVDLMLLKKGTFINEVPSHVNVILLENLKTSLFKRLKFYILNRINTGALHSSQNFWKVFQNDFEKIDKKYDVAIAYSQGFSTYFIAEKTEAQKKYSRLNTDYKKAGYNIKFDLPFYEKFNKVIAVSKDAERGLVEQLKTIGKILSFQVIKDITDQEYILKQSLKPLQIDFNSKAVNIVTVCRLVTEKGLFLAVEACALLIKKNYKINWYVIGDGSERKKLQQMIIQENLQNSFFLLGADSNPYPYMKACDIYVQTSLFEGLGLTVIEASYLNKPIVCTNFPTAYDILVDEETGLLAEMNAESIGAQIERLILSKDLKNLFTTNLLTLVNNDKEITLHQIAKLLV